jgi:hypothetical protein
MYENILTQNQIVLAKKLLPACPDFYLAGGTALALQIGHRRSIDFDLASYNKIDPFKLEKKLISMGFNAQTIFTATGDELSVLIDGIKVTFFMFPFMIKPEVFWGAGQINLPGTIELGAMKAYALGRRNKWKDYIDLYFLLKFNLSMKTLIERAKQIFGPNFNSRLFREQLCYFADIDFSETIEFIDFAPEDKEIKSFLESIAIKI